MRQTQFKEVVIISAELTNESGISNVDRSVNLEKCLDDCNLQFNKASGVYKGSSEKSFIVLPRNSAEINVLKEFAFKNFNQESILFQDKSGDTFLIYSDGKKETIGRLKKVSSKLNLDSYTVLNGEIYTTEVV